MVHDVERFLSEPRTVVFREREVLCQRHADVEEGGPFSIVATQGAAREHSLEALGPKTGPSCLIRIDQEHRISGFLPDTERNISHDFGLGTTEEMMVESSRREVERTAARPLDDPAKLPSTDNVVGDRRQVGTERFSPAERQLNQEVPVELVRPVEIGDVVVGFGKYGSFANPSPL